MSTKFFFVVFFFVVSHHIHPSIPIARLVDELKVDPLAKHPPDGWTPMHCACARGRHKVARALLERGAQLSTATSEGETAITLLAKGKFDKIVMDFIGPDSEYVTWPPFSYHTAVLLSLSIILLSSLHCVASTCSRPDKRKISNRA